MRKNILLTLMVLSSFALTAQTAIGSFTAHTAMHAFSSVAVDATTVYAATDNGLMLLEKGSMYDEHPDISSWTKVEGLSDIDIVGVFHVSQQNSLIICYADGNIDLIQNDRVMNIRDVKDKSLTGSKRLQTCRELDGKTYLVYPFGVVILDVDERVVSDTWFTKRDGEQLTPTDIAVANQRFYISTTEGVFSMPVTSPALSNFSQWTQESSLNVSFLSVASDKLFAMRKPGEYETEAWDTLYTWDGDSWHSTGKAYQSVRYMSSQHDTLLVCNWDGVELLDGDVERIYYAVWYDENAYSDVWQAVLDGDTEGMEDFLTDLLDKCISTFDSSESFYHGFFLSLLYGVPGYEPRSNREEGDGRPDIVLEPRRPKNPAIIFELKTRKKFTEMQGGLREAFDQIRDRRYEEGVLNDGFFRVKAYGICCCKKSCVIGKYEGHVGTG